MAAANLTKVHPRVNDRVSKLCFALIVARITIKLKRTKNRLGFRKEDLIVYNAPECHVDVVMDLVEEAVEGAANQEGA